MVTGDLVLQAGINGTDLVGMVADNSVNVFHPWIDTWAQELPRTSGAGRTPRSRTRALPHRYIDPGTGANNPTDGVQTPLSIQTRSAQLLRAAVQQGFRPGTLLVQGSIAQRWRGIVGTSGGTG